MLPRDLRARPSGVQTCLLQRDSQHPQDLDGDNTGGAVAVRGCEAPDLPLPVSGGKGELFILALSSIPMHDLVLSPSGCLSPVCYSRFDFASLF